MHQSEKQVVLGNEDIKNIEEFFGHFNIPIKALVIQGKSRLSSRSS
jgi:hypothetical protein